MAKTFTLTIRIDDDKKDSVTTSKYLVLALVDCASRLDHGDSDVLKPNGIYTCYANGLQVGKYEITANPEPPIILPTPTKTTVIAAGSLLPGNIVVGGHGYASWKVGEVTHSHDGYTYWDGRTLNGETIYKRHCTLSSAGISVEVR